MEKTQPSPELSPSQRRNTRDPSLEPPQDSLDQGLSALRRSIRLKTMWPKLERLCPPRSERFWIVGGRPGSFKTQFMWNLAVDLAERKQRTLFISLEQTTGELGVQTLSRFSRIPLDRIELAQMKDSPIPFTDSEQSQVDAAILRYTAMELHLRLHGAERHGRAVKQILQSATRNRWDAIFVDHLGMVGRDNGDEWAELGNTIDRLRALARGEVKDGYRPFVCATSPLNRDIDRDQDGDTPRGPRLSDFRGSGRIESDADVAMILQKRRQPEESEEPSIVDAFVLKNRQGRCPLVLQFEAQGAICFVNERQPKEAPPRHFTERNEEADP